MHNTSSTTFDDRYKSALALIMGLFFLCGFTSVMNTILIPYLQNVLRISYTETNLIHTSFYTSYLVVSPIAGWAFRGGNYLTGLRCGIIMSAFGAITLALALGVTSFLCILTAIFILGGGIAITQVCGNPFAVNMGTSASASSRLAIIHGATSLGMILAPLAGSQLIFSSSQMTLPSSSSLCLYAALGVSWIALLGYTFTASQWQSTEIPSSSSHAIKGEISPYRDVVAIIGMAAIALCVGIEAAVATSLIKLFILPNVGNLPYENAAKLSVIFWIGFAAGRFTGGYLLRHVSEVSLLQYHAAAGVLCSLLAVYGEGWTSITAALALGLCTSVLYPIVFSATLTYTHANKNQVSGLLCMSNIGGAIIPIIQAYVADTTTLPLSFLVPLCCYLLLLGYAAFASKLWLKRHQSLGIEIIKYSIAAAMIGVSLACSTAERGVC